MALREPHIMMHCRRLRIYYPNRIACMHAGVSHRGSLELASLKCRIASCASWEPRIDRRSLASREPRIAGASHRGSLASCTCHGSLASRPGEPRTSHASSCVLRSKAQ